MRSTPAHRERGRRTPRGADLPAGQPALLRLPDEPPGLLLLLRRSGETLRYLVAEVTNTPWNERHSYLLRAGPGERVLRCRFDKSFHVSPFNPMEMRYDWRSNTPGERLAIHLENHTQRGREFDATLA
jgi:DUF1365 family protein